jgi:hypothetical protein
MPVVTVGELKYGEVRLDAGKVHNLAKVLSTVRGGFMLRSVWLL